ncbi:MAG TPA: hypothetical protein VGH60_04430 [Solirubrobacteraceae bacterium]|jgi:hypothetical protein
MRPFSCAVPAVLCALGVASLSMASARPLDDDHAPLAGTPALSEAPLRSLTGDSLSPSGTDYVDGISDQSLPSWNGAFPSSRFASFFADTWTAGLSPHISLARYVAQWNVMSGAYPAYLAQLEAWYRDVLSLGLTPDVSLAAYDGVLPGSYLEYRAALRALLDRFPATAYVEAWDEPNDTPGLPADTAALYTNAAQSLCRDRGCTVIAGNFLDSVSVTAYEREYARALLPASFTNWGIHPYLAVKARNASTVLDFRSNLPGAGAGERIWFTEVGAYRCEGGARPERLGERTQALDASWLVNRLMPLIQPTHVFYYEFLFKDGRPPPCDRSNSDTALFVPAGDRNAVDVARVAASYIYDDRDIALP